MKNLIYVVLFIAGLLTSTGLKAQVSIGNNHKYAIGDHVTGSTVDTNNVSEGQPGANRTWNFSNIVVTSEAYSGEFISPVGTPFASSFPDATICQRTDVEGEYAYAYHKQTATENHTLGQSYDQTAIIYSNTMLAGKFPFSFNSTYTDTYAAEFSIDEIVVKKSGTITSTADAYGSITLPAGTFNALRVKTVNSYVDSSFFTGFNFVTAIEVVTYSWYTAQHKFPVFSISYSKSTSNGTTFHIKGAQYSIDQPSAIVLQSTTPDGFQLKQNYPNPFNPTTTINYSIPKSGVVSLKVYNVTGKEVANLINGHQAAGTYKADFDASALPSGTYFYKLETNGTSEVKKMLLIK